MTIEVTRTTIAPRGVSLNKFKPQYKEIYDLQESIFQKYLSDRQPEVTRVDSGDTYTVTIKAYYNSIEDYNNCMIELHDQIGNIANSLLERDRQVARSRVTRLIKIVDLDTGAVIKEETEMPFDAEYGTYAVAG